ncbi:hypothetical protein BDV09DRAFT_195393 [Aspergillus tetrazonus]
MVAAKQVLCAILFGTIHCVQADFVHPGIIFTADQIETLRTNALSGNEPCASSYSALRSNARASAAYKTEGGGALIGRNSGNDTITAWTIAWQNDCYAAWLNSLMYAITLGDSHATTVANIVDAWSGKLTGVVENNNLPTALNGRQLVNVAELTMVSKVLVPNKDPVANPPTQPVVGGNQAAISHVAGMEFAIFTNNATGFQAELDILLLPKTACVGYEGSGMQALIQNKTGRCAEAGRDQGHSADEVGWLEEGARVAENQGNTALFDLESQDGSSTPLLMLGLEYHFNTTPAQMSLLTPPGAPAAVEQFSYNYYHTQKGFSMPYTELWLEAKRPLQTSSNMGDFLVFPTLAWAASSL